MTDAMILQKPSLTVLGIACRTSNAPDAAPHDLPKLWGRFYQENIAAQISNKASNDIIALYCDYEGDYTQPYTCVIGCPVTSIDEIPEGMTAKIIPSATYAVYHVVGEFPKSLIDTWGRIWSTDLKRTYTGDFELYKDIVSSGCLIGSNQELDVFVAVHGK